MPKRQSRPQTRLIEILGLIDRQHKPGFYRVAAESSDHLRALSDAHGALEELADTAGMTTSAVIREMLAAAKAPRHTTRDFQKVSNLELHEAAALAKIFANVMAEVPRSSDEYGNNPTVNSRAKADDDMRVGAAINSLVKLYVDVCDGNGLTLGGVLGDSHPIKEWGNPEVPVMRTMADLIAHSSRARHKALDVVKKDLGAPGLAMGGLSR